MRRVFHTVNRYDFDERKGWVIRMRGFSYMFRCSTFNRFGSQNITFVISPTFLKISSRTNVPKVWMNFTFQDVNYIGCGTCKVSFDLPMSFIPWRSKFLCINRMGTGITFFGAPFKTRILFNYLWSTFWDRRFVYFPKIFFSFYQKK